MTNDFANWLVQNELTEAFTTAAGDSLFTNVKKLFGVIKKYGELGVHSFYLDDIIEVKTYDDEHLVVEWNRFSSWRMYPMSNRYSTNEIFMIIRLKDQTSLRLQFFRGTNGNIPRGTSGHADWINYAYQLTQRVVALASK